MSMEAISWVLEDAPNVPPHLMSALAALAHCADMHGRGTYPSIGHFAHNVRKNTRGTQRDLNQLAELGLVRVDDRQANSIVYILAMERRRAPLSTRSAPPLSLFDRGLLAYLRDHVVEGTLSVARIVADTGSGHDTVSASIRRLEGLGYLRRERQHGARGRFGSWTWTLVDFPHAAQDDALAETGDAAPVNTPTDLYRVFDAAGTLLYVGISDDVSARFDGHRRTALWFGHMDRITLKTYPGRTAAEKAERRAIERERPLFNVDHNNQVGRKAKAAYILAAAKNARGDA